ncbi:MAG TPA: ribosome biogenesis GTP-binding protein YihA/YsxC [Usitatibacteraceae bacterium]|nr:ribosome biogenesis GTP-binding protein YihA/YsxC [Usitatibacteraceae bacterium]
MEKSLFSSLRYSKSAHDLHELPPDIGSEIAFVGRSNSGKSSAINALANHKRLAFVSKTPGRTQLINFFEFGDDLKLVDLPGYGYAKVPEKVRLHWQGVLADFVANRAALRGLVVVMDARHPLGPLDWQLLNWYLPTAKPVHCLLTKADKLSRSDQALTLRRVKAELDLSGANSTVQLFSSLNRQGVEEATSRIAQLLGLQVARVTEKKKGTGKGNPCP